MAWSCSVTSASWSQRPREVSVARRRRTQRSRRTPLKAPPEDFTSLKRPVEESRFVQRPVFELRLWLRPLTAPTRPLPLAPLRAI